MPLIQVYSEALLVLSSAAEASGPFAFDCLSSLPSVSEGHELQQQAWLGVEIMAHCLWV